MRGVFKKPFAFFVYLNRYNRTKYSKVVKKLSHSFCVSAPTYCTQISVCSIVTSKTRGTIFHKYRSILFVLIHSQTPLLNSACILKYRYYSCLPQDFHRSSITFHSISTVRKFPFIMPATIFFSLFIFSIVVSQWLLTAVVFVSF